MSDFRRKVIKGLKWSVLMRTILLLIQTALGIVLARILLPEDFGLIAMLAIFLAVANALTDSGLSAALVQKRNPTEIDKSTIFYFNISVGILITFIIFIAAPWVSKFYNEPRLTLLLRVLSLNILFTSLNNVQTWLLNKELNFKVQFYSSFTSTIISGLIGVLLALNGCGVWSLVAYSTISIFLNTVIIWQLSSWRPRKAFSLNSLKKLFSFSFNILLTSQISTICNELYYVIIGKLFSAQLLGFYARARQTRDIPLNLISSIFQSITFPAFSMIQDDPSRQKRLMRNAINNIAFFNFPVMIGLSIVAQPTISILLTDKWLDSVPLMQLFCFGGLLSPFTTVYTGYILSRGKSKTNLKIAIIINSLRIFLLIFTWKWGIAGIVWGEVVLSFLSYSIYMFWLSKNIDYKLREQLSDTIPYLVAASLMGVSAFFAGALLGNASPYTLLSTQIAVGTLSYFLICVIFQPLAYRDSISQVLQYLRPNRTPDL